MHVVKHALVGAVLGAAAASAPDVLLLLFGWRRDWLPEAHPLVRAHRFIHAPTGLLAVVTLAYASHIVIDWYSPHRSAPEASCPD